MQGLVDHRGHFMNINIGWPGRVHDARVFSNSSIYNMGEQETLFPDIPMIICGTSVPLVILDDPAYPLLFWVMKAFQDNGSLTAEQKKFNSKSCICFGGTCLWQTEGEVAVPAEEARCQYRECA